MDRKTQNRLSADWAAYCDALGFMTELADADRVQYRIGTDLVHDTTAWRRKVGGYSGVNIDFPAGTYSDDTQLRLCTSRAIRGDGTFDVASFAKVELPAWSNYALGAGAGSREAASNLARTSATWYSNFFDSKRSTYLSAGGNGAAMRIQPHVWAASDLSNSDAVLLDVFRNAICTHGHPRGIVGACFHALSLLFAFESQRPAGLSDLNRMVEQLGSLLNLVERDGDIRLLWLGAWEATAGKSFGESITESLGEISTDLAALEQFKGRLISEVYPQIAETLGAYDASSRGSGTKTAVMAAFAASLVDIHNPLPGFLTIINLLGTDTDSIATMAGAIVGACTDSECDGTIQDREYIDAEASRLASVASRSEASSFRYPDLRSWKPARAAIDAIGTLDDDLWLSGLGPLELLMASPIRDGASEVVGWCKLPFGQTILARFRSNPVRLTPEQAGVELVKGRERGRSATLPPGKLRDVLDKGSNGQSASASLDNDTATINELLKRVVGEGFAPALIGQILLDQVDRGGKDFVERGIALTANILTAYEARAKRRRK